MCPVFMELRTSTSSAHFLMEGSERWGPLINVLFDGLVFVSWKQLEQRLLKTAKEKMEQLSRALSESE